MVYPDFIGLVDVGEKISLFGLPVASASYAYSVIPVIMMAWVMTYVEKLADKITPAPRSFFNLITKLNLNFSTKNKKSEISFNIHKIPFFHCSILLLLTLQYPSNSLLLLLQQNINHF